MTEIQNPKQLAFDPPPADLDIVIWNLPALLNKNFEFCCISIECDLNY
jgi:hypothetical protein